MTKCVVMYMQTTVSSRLYLKVLQQTKHEYMKLHVTRNLTECWFYVMTE